MDSQLQRDLGRVEATVSIVKDDVKTIKEDLATIKEKLTASSAVKESDWKRLSVIAVLASLVTHSINWFRLF